MRTLGAKEKATNAWINYPKGCQRCTASHRMGKYMELRLPYLAAIHPRIKPPMWQSKRNQQRPNHSCKGFLKSKQSGCSQFQKISRQPRRGKNNTKIFQVKTERLLSISEEIKTAQICLKQHSFTWNSADILKTMYRTFHRATDMEKAGGI